MDHSPEMIRAAGSDVPRVLFERLRSRISHLKEKAEPAIAMDLPRHRDEFDGQVLPLEALLSLEGRVGRGKGGYDQHGFKE